MAKITHNISSPNDGLGDALRTAMSHQNSMNTELYDTKVDKIDGFGLSENNLTDALVVKIESLGTPYIPTLQEVLDNNRDLINGNNFQGKNAGKDQTGVDNTGFGNSALSGNSGSNVNAFGLDAGNSNTFSNVNLLGNLATADEDNQTVFTKDAGEARARISYNGITADRKYELPDKDGTFALLSDTSKSEYKTASFTAEKGTYYVVFWSGITVTDPATATNGDYFTIFTHYPITVGGVSIPAQSFIYRNYYGGNWQTIDLTNVTAINTLNTGLDTRTKTVIKTTTAGSTITGTTAETLVGTYLIPANTFTANDIMRISSFLAEKTGVVGTCTMRIKVGTTSTFSSATTIATYTTGVNELWCVMHRNAITLRGGNLRTLLAGSSRQTDIVATSVAISTIAFDPTIDNYLFTSLQLSNVADSVFQSNFIVTN